MTTLPDFAWELVFSFLDWRLLRVRIPDGVQAGQEFFFDEGQSVVGSSSSSSIRLICPLGKHPGDTIQFALPVAQQPLRSSNNWWNPPQSYPLLEEQEWSRLYSLQIDSKPKFVWTRRRRRRRQEEGLPSRILRLLEDSPLENKMEWILAEGAETHPIGLKASSSYPHATDAEILSEFFRPVFDNNNFYWYNKCGWFQKISDQWCQHLQRITIETRRDHLIEDVLKITKSFTLDQWQAIWKPSFVNEANDDHLLYRNWCHGVLHELIDYELFVGNRETPGKLEINRMSEWIEEDHLECFRLVGNILGRCLVHMGFVLHDRHKFPPRYYKLLLQWPLGIEDLDPDDFQRLRTLLQYRNDDTGEWDAGIEYLCLNFATVHTDFGVEEVELVPGGADMEVTKDNAEEFVKLWCKYRLVGSVEKQLAALARGFYDVVPSPLLNWLNPQELQWLLNGSPDPLE